MLECRHLKTANGRQPWPLQGCWEVVSDEGRGGRINSGALSRTEILHLSASKRGQGMGCGASAREWWI